MIELTVPKCDGRLRILDELKGLAIIGIVLYHAGGALTWRNFLHGDIGVDIFLILSGLALALSSSEAAPGAFLLRRLMRVFPAYWVALAFFLVMNHWVLGIPYTMTDVAAHIFGLHAFFGDGIAFSISPGFWFITPLFFYYACFAWMRGLLGSTDRFIAVSGFLAAAVSLGIFMSGQGSLMGHWGFRAVAFFMGVLAGRALRDGGIQFPTTPWLAVGLLLAFYVPYMFGIAFHTTFAGAAVMLAFVGARPWWTGTAVGARVNSVLGWFGDHSLEIFLLHQPLMRDYVYWALGRTFGGGPYSDILVVAAMALALGLTLFLAMELRLLLARLNPVRR